MKKFLRYYLVVIMALFCGTMMAGEVTFTAGTDGTGNSTASKQTLTKDGITLEVSNGILNGSNYRIYKGQTLTISSTVGNITKVEFTCTASGTDQYGPGCFAELSGYSYDGNNGTWTGDAASVVFTASSAQVRATTIVVTYSGSTTTVSAPTISGTTPFTESTQVTITGTPDGGKTYYTTDGSDPTSSSTAYAAPFTINETTTVKAINYDKDGNASSIASKTFEKETIEKVANIAEFNKLAKGTKCELTLTNAQVLGATNATSNKNFVIKDATGSTVIFDKNATLSFTKGQILNGTISGERTDYNGFTELQNLTGNTLTATDGTITPKTATPEEVIAAGYFAETYKMEKVQCTLKQVTNSNGSVTSRYYITVGDKDIQIFDNFKYNYSITADGKYNLVGVLGAYSGVSYQFWLTEAPEAAEEVTIPEASDIDDFKSQDQGKLINLNLANAQVVYAWTSSNGNIQAFVRDDTGAICMDFRNNNEPGKSFTTDKIVNGSIIMNNTVYNGLPQASATAETNTEKLTFSDGSAAEPVKISSADVSRKINDLVLLENVTITEKEVTNGDKTTKYYYVDDVQLYNQFKLEAFNDFSSFVGEGKTIKGIAVVFNTTYEIYPIEITTQETGTKAYWDLATWENVNVTSKVTVDGLTYYGEAKSAYSAGNNTFTKDESSIKCTGRIKMGGGSTFKTDSYSRVFAFNATKGQNVIVFGTHGSSDGEARTIYLSQEASDTNRDPETSFASKTYEAGEKLWFEATVPEDGTVYVWADNNMGIYMISVGYTFEELATTTGIETIITDFINNGIRYNLAGQRVDENYKGVVIMNGKKYVVK